MAPVPVALVDHDCALDKALLLDVAEMLTTISQRDFARPEPFGYGLGAVVRVAQSITDVAPGEWTMGYWSRPDVPGALGYHDMAPNGMPMLHVFPFLDDAANRGITESHELFEALADADCVTAVVGPDGVIRAREPGDPVEATSFDFTCLSGRTIKCSNWVTPAYFSPPVLGGVPLDAMNLVRHCGEILSGGYQITYDSATSSWAQTVNGEKSAYRKAVEAAGITRFAKRVGRRSKMSPLDSLANLIASKIE